MTECLHHPEFNFFLSYSSFPLAMEVGVRQPQVPGKTTPFDGIVLILSESGKPIFSSSGNEEELLNQFSFICAFVHRYQLMMVSQRNVAEGHQREALLSIQTPSQYIQFLHRSPLIFCLISRQPWNLAIQIDTIYNQIISVFSRQMLKGYYTKKPNFDIRSLFDGIDKRIDACIKGFNEDPAVLYGFRILPLNPVDRDFLIQTMGTAINELCPETVAFGLLIAHRQLVTLVRMKKLYLEASDFNTIVNLIECHKANLMQLDHQFPICLPKFNPNSFLYAYVSYLWDGTGPCMVLLSISKEASEQLCRVRPRVEETLCSYKRYDTLKEALLRPEGFTLKSAHCGPQLWHFMYKNTSNSWDPTQVCCSTPKKPFISAEELIILYSGYAKLADLLKKCGNGSVKTLFLMQEKYSLFAWIMPGFELYCTFNPLVTKRDVMDAADRLLRLLRKEEKRVLYSVNPGVLTG